MDEGDGPSPPSRVDITAAVWSPDDLARTGEESDDDAADNTPGESGVRTRHFPMGCPTRPFHGSFSYCSSFCAVQVCSQLPLVSQLGPSAVLLGEPCDPLPQATTLAAAADAALPSNLPLAMARLQDRATLLRLLRAKEFGAVWQALQTLRLALRQYKHFALKALEDVECLPDFSRLSTDDDT